MAEGDALPLDHVYAHRGGVEQDIHNVIIQQVDFVDIKQTAVCGSQHARLEMALAFLNRAFDIQRADHAVLCG